jgi:hypothetical protein
MPEQVYAFVGRCEHGKVRAIAVDLPNYKRLTDRDVANFVRNGLTVERVTVEDARRLSIVCYQCQRKFKNAKRNAF